MGRKEDVIIEYLEDSSVFASLYNGYVFQGEPVIQPDDLRDSNGKNRLFVAGENAGKKTESYEIIKRERDIIKEITIDNQILSLAILAVEEQSNVDYSMVLRTLTYDTLEYLRQVKVIQRRHKKNKDLKQSEFLSMFSKDDRLLPTMTIVFYIGENEWDGATDLHSLMMESEFCDSIKPYLGNWKLNVLSVHHMKNADHYSGSLGQIFKLLEYRNDGKAMLQYVGEHRQEYASMDDVARRVLSMLVELDYYVEPEKDGEVQEMCKALEEIREMGIEQGIEQGIELGVKKGSVLAYTEMGLSVQEVAQKLSLSEEEIQHIIENAD